MFPTNHSKYVEVFGGGGWVLFGKRQRQGCMEVYNDLNGDLVNLFLCVKHRCMPLILELGFLPLNSRDEFKVLRKYLAKEDFKDSFLKENLELAKNNIPGPEGEEICKLLTTQADQYDVERAAVYYKSIRYSYGSGGNSFGARPLDIRDFFHLFWTCSHRLAKVVIEHKDFEALIKQYDSPDTLFYCDPPYYDAECYAVSFPKEDHKRLHDILANCQGKWMVSYNDVPFIRNLYSDYHIFSIKRIDNQAQRYEAGKEYAEVIITNYDPAKYAKTEPKQLTLFSEPSEEKDKYNLRRES